MLNTCYPKISKPLLLSSIVAGLMVSACNDSNASQSANVVAQPTNSAQESSVALVTTPSNINNRNHVCFTMDVNNVKCVLGDTVVYVPQPILDENKQEAPATAKDTKKGNAKDAKANEEKEAQAQLIANQNALNEARSLVFVAKYCDLQKSVVYSKEGVACNFKPHALYDAGAVAEATQYNMNLMSADEFFKEISGIKGVEKFSDPAFGKHGGYRIFLAHGADKNGLKIGADTTARILTKRIDMDGNVLGFYTEELNFENLNPQMKILTSGLVAGDHVKLVFDTSLQNEQPLWRTSSLEFGQPYIWEVTVQSVQKYDPSKAKAAAQTTTPAAPAAAPAADAKK